MKFISKIIKKLRGRKGKGNEENPSGQTQHATLPDNLVVDDEILTRVPAKSVLPTLPDHLVVEGILTRLPAKSLLRFKSVCKNWYSTIKKPTFIRLHHNRAQTRPDRGCLAISMSMPKADPFEYRPLEYNLFTAGYQGGPASRLLSSRRYYASISTHGLILLSPKTCYKVFRPVIYNPTTKELVSLPIIPIYIDHRPSDRICAEYSLGYDPSTGQYKVLAICTLSPPKKTAGEKDSYHLFIFVLGTDSWTWRTLDIDFPRPKRIVPFSACVNGALHWLVRPNDFCSIMNYSGGHEFILAFDIGKEEFHKIPLSGRPASLNLLTEVGGRLALSHHAIGKKLVPEVWVLEDYDKGEWMKVKVEAPLEWKYKMKWCDVHAIDSGETFMVTPHCIKMSEGLRVCYFDKSGKRCCMVEVTGIPLDTTFINDTVLVDVSDNVETLFSPRAGLISSNTFEFSSADSKCTVDGICLH